MPYNYTHLGNSAATLKQLADGSHPLSDRFRQAEFPMVMVSALTLERTDGAAIWDQILRLQDNSNLINSGEHWNGINVLNNDVGRINALELGITSIPEPVERSKVVYLLGCDNFRHEEIPEDAFVIY